jgi:3-oxoacyl-[acyl-carrier protein] reductase
MPRSAPPYPKPNNLLAGKTVLVTAAAGSGIGFAAAKRCAEEGATVMISDIHDKRLNKALESLNADDSRHFAQTCNVTSQTEVDALLSEAIEKLGHIDVLINNAGLGGTAEMVNMTDEQWNMVIDVSLTGTFRMTRAALKHMLPREQGAIINNASVIGWRAQAGQSHYAAAKAGVMAMTRCVAMEAARAGVRVNAVSPSLAMHAHLHRVTTKELLDELTAKEAFGRAAEPWEIANVMVFLASDYASYLTGETISASSQHP